MSDSLNRIKKRLEEFKESPVGYGAKLRLDFAEIIWRNLERNKWSQRRLSKEVGLPDSVISNLIHGNKNCTLDTVGKVIHALGTEAAIAEKDHSAEAAPGTTLWYHGTSGEGVPYSTKEQTSVQAKRIEIKVAETERCAAFTGGPRRAVR